MNWQEIAGGLVNALRNAGVKKDVIDLQEKQLALLTGKIMTLEREKSDLMMQTTNLKNQVTELELELERLRPKQDRLDETQEKFLQLLAKHEELTIEQIAGSLGVSKVIAEHHKDCLFDADMIQWTSIGISIGFGESPATIGLLSKGRAYLVKNKLV